MNPGSGGRAVLGRGSNVSDIFTKLQAADGAQAIIRAREAGLG
jgi:hypothetical protein